MITERPKFQLVLAKARDQVRTGLELTGQMMSQVAQEAPGELKNRLEHITSRKGKRVRATIMFLIGGMKPPHSDADLKRQARVAASLEMLHLASLVHDDVIDESSLRRGIQTANAEWGNKMAVLVGDYILSKSMELGVGDPDSRIPGILSAASSLLVAGEVMEIDIAGRLDVPLEDYFQVIHGKTASLFDACARSGAILAGLDDNLVEDCGQLGRHFGLTFQIVDDLLDYGVGAEDLGKATFTDLTNGVVTLPLLLYFQNCEATAQAEMQQFLHQASQGDAQAAVQIQTLLNDSGVFEQAMGIALDHIYEAMIILDRLPLGPGRDLLLEICSSVAHRNN